MDPTPHPHPIHSDHVSLPFTQTQTPLVLHSDGTLTWQDSSKSLSLLSIEKQVLSVSLVGPTILLKCVVHKSSHGIFSSCCGGSTSSSSLVRSCFKFQPSSDSSLLAWFTKIRDFIHTLGRPKRLFVLVNPYGGQKSASKIFVDTIKPLLEDAEVEYTLQETKYQLHAKELAKDLDLTKYDGIVCVSGDGLLVEVVNGLLERNDWDTAIKMPLGVIPAGTGNGMAKSLLDSVGDPCSAINATLAVLRGHKRSLDVATVSQGKARCFSVLMLAWGLVADIDIESEKWRWMGSARFDLYAIKRILQLRRYNGRLHFVPAPGFEDYAEKMSQRVVSVHDVPFCSSSNIQSGAQDNGYIGPNINLEKLNWRTIEGPFISVWIHNVPWGSENAMPAPNAKFSDGFVDVILTKDASNLSILSSMSGLSNGDHVKSPHVLYFKVKTLVLEPGPRTSDSSKGGIIDCDGEVLARGNGTYKCEEKSLMSYGNILVTMDQALATLFSPLV